MAYLFLKIIEYPYTGDGFRYPAIDETGSIIRESWDGCISAAYPLASLVIKKRAAGEEQWQEVTGAHGVHMDFRYSDSRMLITCEDYNKGNGGRWAGGLTALAANAITSAAEKNLRKGKILAGHIRWEWLRQIGYIEKQGVLSYDAIYIWIEDTDKSLYRIVLCFKGQVPVRQLANDIFRKAIDYVSRMPDEKSDKELRFYEQSRNTGIPHDDDPKKVSAKKFLMWYRAPNGAKFRPLLPGETLESCGLKTETAHPAESSAAVPETADVPTQVVVTPTAASSENSDNIEADIQPQTADSTAPAFCPDCGTKLTPNANFCPHCGRKLK